MKRNLYSFILLIILFSCIKEMEINENPTQKKLIVECLFSTEENWDLVLSTTKNIEENNDEYIEDAIVEVLPEEGTPILLVHQGMGHYQAETKPKIGIIYSLRIILPDFAEITAQSSIPVPFTAEVKNIKPNWIKYMYPNDLMDYDVFPLKVIFEEQVSNGHFLFRAHSFNPESGYIRYKLPSSVFADLRRKGIPEKGIERLSDHVDIWQVETQVFYDCMIGLGDVMEINYYNNLISKELKQKNINNREYKAFIHANCFSNDNWLNNISYDTYSVFGNGQMVKDANLFYCEPNLKYALENGYNNNHREYWLEVTQGDLNYFEYYRTYVLQVSQRVNPYSEPVSVYSNINNGIGIFAGYNRQMIHLFDY